MNAALNALMPAQYVDRFRDTQGDAASLAARLAAVNTQGVDATAAVNQQADASEASDNRATAERTGALARTLATARRSPGGGIRMGGGRRGFNASSAGGGLNRANAQRNRAARLADVGAQTAARAAEATAQEGVASLDRARSGLSTYAAGRREAWGRNMARGAITTYS